MARAKRALFRCAREPDLQDESISRMDSWACAGAGKSGICNIPWCADLKQLKATRGVKKRQSQGGCRNITFSAESYCFERCEIPWARSSHKLSIRSYRKSFQDENIDDYHAYPVLENVSVSLARSCNTCRSSSGRLPSRCGIVQSGSFARLAQSPVLPVVDNSRA
jgi:hypothetical protein